MDNFKNLKMLKSFKDKTFIEFNNLIEIEIVICKCNQEDHLLVQ